MAKEKLNLGLISFVIIYVIFNIFKTERIVVINQIVLSILYSIIYTFLWAAKPYAVPMELKYVIYLLSILIILKILIKFNLYAKCAKDWLVILSFIFVIISGCLAILNNISFVNYTMSLQIYLKFLPAYIVISTNNRYSKKDLYLLSSINIFMIFIQYVEYKRGKLITDYISGIFGTSNVQALLLFVIIIYSILLTCYIYKKINFIKFSIGIVVLFIIAGISEIKIFFILVPFITIVVLILNFKKIIRFSKVFIPVVIFMVIGIRILISISPFFGSFFNLSTIKSNIYNYTMVTNNTEFKLGRLENIVYSNKNILISRNLKIFGLGVGSAMPDENWYYKIHDMGNRTIFNLYETDLYKLYGPYLGYHFSSMNIIYLESGLIGIFIFYIAIIIQYYRSYKLFRKTKELKDKCLGTATMIILLVAIPLMFYYPYLLDINASLIFVIISALTTNRYYDLFNKTLQKNKVSRREQS
jgi:hypothetical protein